MLKNRHTLWSGVVVLFFGFALFYVGTDGFRAFTAETARMYKLVEQKPALPHVTLEDSNGRIYPISKFEDKYLFITFMYTSCGTVCPVLEMNMGQVFENIPQQYVGEDIIFLSISFDIENDDPKELAQYQEHFYQADGETWRMARMVDEDEMTLLLDTLGVIVIPDGKDDFAHNSAFYFVDRNGSLMDIMDYTKINEAADRVVSILNQEKEG